MASTITIDDNDERIRYVGKEWETLRGSSSQYQSTVHSTWGFNDSATLNFSGTGVWVYGTIPSGIGKMVTTRYSMDGDSGVVVFINATSTTMYGVKLWYSGVLPNGKHTLTMANLGEDDDRDFELDRIVVETSQISGSASSTIGSSSSTTSGGTSPAPGAGKSTWSGTSNPSVTAAPVPTSSTIIGSSSSTTSGSASPTASDGQSSPPGTTNLSSTAAPVPIIVGGTVGGLVVLILVTIVFVCARRRRKRYESEASKTAPRNPEAVTPFTLFHPPSGGNIPQNPTGTFVPNLTLKIPEHSESTTSLPSRTPLSLQTETSQIARYSNSLFAPSPVAVATPMPTSAAQASFHPFPLEPIESLPEEQPPVYTPSVVQHQSYAYR